MGKKIDEIKNLRGKIRLILEESPEARDNDRRIYVELLLDWMHSKYMSAAKTNAIDLLKSIYLQRDVPNMGSVVRARALLQSKHPELRGESYDARIRIGKETKADFADLKRQMLQFDPYPHHNTPRNCKCGSMVLIHHNDPDVWVECPECHRKSGIHITGDEAAIQWNEMMKDLELFKKIFPANR